MKGKRGNSIYALYKGETNLMDGTLEELARKRGVSRATMIYYKSHAYRQRCQADSERVYLVPIDVKEAGR